MFSETLVSWYDKEGRKLPWRETINPYHILVSEIMLQQTQVERVKVFYAQWLERFPNWESLAAATDGEVINQWAGLGYNRRALSLRNIARQVVENGLPENRDGWLMLKGIGPYTSAALSVFSLRLKKLPIDTNIRRVLGRYFLGLAYPDVKDDAAIENAAKEVLDHERFYDVPQAIFDLATMYCTKVPDCATCPLRDSCPMAAEFLSGSIVPPKRMVKKGKERIRDGKRYPDRIFRGRILKLFREKGPHADIEAIGSEIDDSFDVDRDDAWVRAMLDRLEKDRLIVYVEGFWRIPQ